MCGTSSPGPGEVCRGRGRGMRQENAADRSRQGRDRFGGALQRRQRHIEPRNFGFETWKCQLPRRFARHQGIFLLNRAAGAAEALKAIGIKIVSFANNHVMDLGLAGLYRDSRTPEGDRAARTWALRTMRRAGLAGDRGGQRHLKGWLGMTVRPAGNRKIPARDFFPYPAPTRRRRGADGGTVLAAVKAARGRRFAWSSHSLGRGIRDRTTARGCDLATKEVDAGVGDIERIRTCCRQFETYRAEYGAQ